MTKVAIIKCGAQDELLRWYRGEQGPQPVYIALDVISGRLWADYDANVDGGCSPEVYHGFERHWEIPLLTGDAVNELLAQVAPLAERVMAGAEKVWDGSNTVIRLDTDALAAVEDIADLLPRCDDRDAVGLLPVYDVDSIGEMWTAEEAGITGATTDEAIEATAQRLLAEFRDGSGEPDAVIDGLEDYLRCLRDASPSPC
ncbi:hypothetical protein NQK81_02540 [Amycolatopsis roodepoortensis]|uniref:hypothetical protein n=1 Tax=Amycolatopsis roodepoortensis TaxID=700274 RepID=UPI00214C6B43|nr:hypothetical protein [Amycolatopsis roodepoortensis]UUV32352.1 hypothetical protein NQK81_02540 [Amycolatopsis roodepoortensis]